LLFNVIAWMATRLALESHRYPRLSKLVNFARHLGTENYKASTRVGGMAMALYEEDPRGDLSWRFLRWISQGDLAGEAFDKIRGRIYDNQFIQSQNSSQIEDNVNFEQRRMMHLLGSAYPAIVFAIYPDEDKEFPRVMMEQVKANLSTLGKRFQEIPFDFSKPHAGKQSLAIGHNNPLPQLTNELHIPPVDTLFVSGIPGRELGDRFVSNFWAYFDMSLDHYSKLLPGGQVVFWLPKSMAGKESRARSGIASQPIRYDFTEPPAHNNSVQRPPIGFTRSRQFERDA